jgi:predicted PhzF superfamily epimerase YddE/YHI9
VILTTVLATADDVADATTSQVHSRALFPGIIGEDTVTGSAHCSLAVLHSPRFGGPGAEVRCTQGFGPRRTGALRVVWDGKTGREGGRVKLRGDAFVIAEGRLLL